MAVVLPLRLLHYVDGIFSVIDSRSHNVQEYDIISYTWGAKEEREYDPQINGVTWAFTLKKEKLAQIKMLMRASGIQYLWVDSLCLNQADEREKAVEMSKMFQYYKSARKCHILIEMTEVWDPLQIVNDLKFIDHILSHMGGAALASEAMKLTENMHNRLAMWADTAHWNFPVDKSIVRSAAVDMGVLNCYATCISRVSSLFHNLYFSRVWTFQEMILGKNITMWAIKKSPENREDISNIRELDTWMDLATDSRDKASKLKDWIASCRVLKTGAIDAILRIIEEDNLILWILQLRVQGISRAREDIINGGPNWWYENYKGISNIFSAISLTPRECYQKRDIFRGLLGIFNGLFTPEEIERDMTGDDIEKISFNFFKQLSTKTEFAWTKLAISSTKRGEWDWIPVVEDYSGDMTTDCFAGVVKLGKLKAKGQAKTIAMTGVKGAPRKYMKIRLRQQQNSDFQFIFKGCNCGKKVKTGTFSSELIPTYDQPKDVYKDETGRILVQCATVLGSIMDPGCDVIQYRRKLLHNLQPEWTTSDPIAKPTGWVDRCVSGTFWENPSREYVRVHNQSMNYRIVDITGCESRLYNKRTESISCEVTVNCGCTIIAPFSLIFGAMTAVEGSFLGERAADIGPDGRIILRDGLGLVQVGDVGKTFNLVAFGGDINAHKAYASSCRSTKDEKPVIPKLPWPNGRALVREEFTHDLTDVMRDYAYVETGGSGNLLISRNHKLDQYKIVGVCIDEWIANDKGQDTVTIR
ncbi:hypothetical protein M501DRAFT_1020538 [Patellaria atrata CBS 101060]|uniref:Heterokaryon incompatibility domain-containing protein n=1 Tax=Patellaria atrata CBS 101060 TaxID=1346257 RepID=A0A9P4VMK1_9PEZI|nr:hypothetical protein M501DRAFT_1020538 [Patellaria atrata CBS 101060]